MAMDPIEIIERYYRPDSRAYRIVVAHGGQVRDKALEVAGAVREPEVDLDFIAQAAMVHDIGILETDSPELGCSGSQPYVCHGELGARMLEACGLLRHARVCRTHVGVGLTAEEIRQRNLPLPEVDMVPQTMEEKIICYADKFFSKNGGVPREKSLEEVIASLARWGSDKVERFLSWHRVFETRS